ncbi:MAG: hemerythrin family protein [Ruminococcaceae bacterium]|nr:hemerythrin family protein [Oscillospiraceae bacterium]
MEQELFEWKEEYKLGVESIDSAHKQLFSIVNRIISNFMDKDYEKSKTTCMEAIKYLKTYTVKHFAEEEAYQQSINYPGYAVHKKIHDNMRDVVIPNLEKEIVAKSYSKEALEHFIGVCAGWLAAHVLVEDQAITGKTKSKWTQNAAATDNKDDFFDGIVRNYIKVLFQMNAKLANAKYAGYKLSNPFCYGDTFTTANGDIYGMMTAVEENVLQYIASEFIDEKAFDLDAVMNSMLGEIISSFNLQLVMAFVGKSPSSLKSQIISETEFYSQYKNIYPDYTMLWRTDRGYIAVCLKKLNAEQFATYKDN